MAAVLVKSGVRQTQTADLQTADLQTCRPTDLQTCRLAEKNLDLLEHGPRGIGR